ncbi:MAG: OmpA family protein [Treponema sp.]|jgi:outer membrane protein OmpA-like peptidoglycan-associated protein|nr:OmpA family protein [Treponema sp.]
MKVFVFWGGVFVLALLWSFADLSAQDAETGDERAAIPVSGAGEAKAGTEKSGVTGSSSVAKPVRLSAFRAGAYSQIERSDWSRYDNGKYTGHVYHEVRSSVVPSELGNGEGFSFQGNFVVLEETLRDMRQSARPMDMVILAVFRLDKNGNITVDGDKGYPALRSFPSFPDRELLPGDKWIAPGSRMVDPLNQGTGEFISFIAEYEYRGIGLYQNIPVHQISARYTLPSRGKTEIPLSPASFQVRGVHTVEILLRTSDGLLLLMRDNLDDTYTWPDGRTLRFRGFSLVFGQGIAPLESAAVISRPGKDVDVDNVPGGIRLRVKNLRFAPDSDLFLAEEQPRLDQIARSLMDIPGRTILVEGHTAATGRPEGEMELSISRAKRMIDERVRRGIPADRFVYKGWGSQKPLGDNAAEDGRIANRRVEITILE